ncbi:MAG: ExbD/TolR family protein [Planctomycetota bacterium]|jgi:biopolymer transport protein ExbD
MAKKKSASAAELSKNEEMDLTSMIDVVFLLIIFFLCVTELADASKEKLTLPQARKASEDTHEPGRLVINVTKEGDVFIQRKKLDDKQLYLKLQEEKRASWDAAKKIPTRAILIRVDRKTQFKDVQTVMALCTAHKLWKIAFATETG